MCNFAAFAATTAVVVDFQYVTTCRDSTTNLRGMQKMSIWKWKLDRVCNGISDLQRFRRYVWLFVRLWESLWNKYIFLNLRRMQEISQTHTAEMRENE